ncbi:MAG: undecaprenyldiphospho-muramoylpentapeptide beta-N-acetylglucosaminyltransferase [Tepidanaerobacteraceae bacterium]|jgi:UDP-N-acetylglucosamine--N-acetylmuramyl-(pentapeptide) pyrophosphoryl-undecaprenol N-acetylglucosamine transferase|nr:undecaprenyldiphospho-muramoylpentapeptide beta-N-acetylglucosaminyltransferase [Tepidanaerobacteraceae bacterium]
MQKKSFVLAGGGTGGHIYPAIAIASGLKRDFPDAEIIFVGTERGLEKDLVPKAGFNLKKIRIKGFDRKLSMDTLSSIKELFLGSLDSMRILAQIKPDLVIGTGGYVAGPVIFFASMMGIPTIIHEQNVKPGFTNRFLSKFADKIVISFEDSKKYFPQNKVILAGNPVRAEIAMGNREEALKEYRLRSDAPVVLCFGGSQGAARLNEAMIQVIEEAVRNRKFQVILVTGQKHYDKYNQLLENKGIDASVSGYIKLKPYIYDMKNAYAASDLVIARAGAISISEITLCGKPSILIPYPKAADRHQDFNAHFLEKNKAAVVIADKDLTGRRLLEAIESIILDKKRLSAMAEASRKLAKPHALEIILDEMKKLMS